MHGPKQWPSLLITLVVGVWAFAEPPRPNILLVNVDDWGWSDAGFQGSRYYETPHIDAFARRGTIFRQAYAAAANCAPSRACMMSGQWAPRHGVYTVGSSKRGRSRDRRLIPTRNTKFLADQTVTIAEELKSAGYETITIGKWHLGLDPRTQGFLVNVGGTERGHPRSYFSPYRNPALSDGPPGEHLTDRLTDEAITVLKTARTGPLFLYLPYFAVHTPLQAKPELVAKYRQKPGTPGQSHPVYAAMIETLDRNIGRLLKAVEESGNLRNTIVILTSDNGPVRAVSSPHPLRAGKGSYYEGGIRVPLIIAWHGKFAAGATCDVPVTQIDLYPTLLEASGTEASPGKQLDGKSLIPLLRGRSEWPERSLFWHFPVYLQAYSPELDDARDPLFRTRPGSVIRSGSWKLHEYFEDGGIELYNLRSDPSERQNLAATYPARAERLLQQLQRWRQKLKTPVPDQVNPDYRPR